MFFIKIVFLFFTINNIVSSQKMFGDSILASSTPIQKDLENHIHKSLKNYATIGSSLQDGWVISIPEQYNKNKLPIPKTIIMDGGGNDVFSIRWESTVGLLNSN